MHRRSCQDLQYFEVRRTSVLRRKFLVTALNCVGEVLTDADKFVVALEPLLRVEDELRHNNKQNLTQLSVGDHTVLDSITWHPRSASFH